MTDLAVPNVYLVGLAVLNLVTEVAADSPVWFGDGVSGSVAGSGHFAGDE